jgi:hypothetical protein
MRRGTAFSTVDWRKYLDVNVNPRAKTFLDSRGDDVLWQIASEINRTNMTPGQHELVILVHPNAGAVIRISKKDFTEVLDMCMEWFKIKEKYELCSKIKQFISYNQKKKSPNKLQKIKKLII